MDTNMYALRCMKSDLQESMCIEIGPKATADVLKCTYTRLLVALIRCRPCPMATYGRIPRDKSVMAWQSPVAGSWLCSHRDAGAPIRAFEFVARKVMVPAVHRSV